VVARLGYEGNQIWQVSALPRFQFAGFALKAAEISGCCAPGAGHGAGPLFFKRKGPLINNGPFSGDARRGATGITSPFLT